MAWGYVIAHKPMLGLNQHMNQLVPKRAQAAQVQSVNQVQNLSVIFMLFSITALESF